MRHCKWLCVRRMNNHLANESSRMMMIETRESEIAILFLFGRRNRHTYDARAYSNSNR